MKRCSKWQTEPIFTLLLFLLWLFSKQQQRIGIHWWFFFFFFLLFYKPFFLAMTSLKSQSVLIFQDSFSINKSHCELHDTASLFPLPGAMKCTHTSDCAPWCNEVRFRKCKVFRSLHLQVVSDAMYRIVKAAAEFPGSCHDSFIGRHPGREASETGQKWSGMTLCWGLFFFFRKKYFKHFSFFQISIQLPTPFSKAFLLKWITTFMSDPEIPSEMNYTPSDMSFPEQ